MDNLRNVLPQTGMEISADHGAEGEAPLQVGHYLLQRELGRGFSSIVYEARDLSRSRTVALKVLTFLQSLSEDRRADLSHRFEREARAVSALTHPSIVAIYEVGQTPDGRQFIAMEHLRGESLRQRLQQATPLSIPQAVAIAVRIADALHYAHGRGIVHRDVKPDNIFLVDELLESPVTPKLMDFGIAHVLSDQGLTQDGTIVGSPAYMSPEQINGDALDARTDVFSLAVTLAEMVTGTKPFEAGTIPAVMQQILHHAPNLRGVANKPLLRVLTKALAKNPSGRYPDAEAFAQALREAVPLATLSPTIATHIIDNAPSGGRPIRLGKRPPIAAVGFGGLTLTVLALLPLFAPRPAQPAYQPLPPAAALQRLPSPTVLHRRISAAWRRAAPPRLSSVRIARSKPERGVLPSYYPDSKPYSVQSRSQKAPVRPATPASPAAPAQPAIPAQPILAAAIQPKPSRPDFQPGKPIVRIAGSQQELIQPAKSIPAVVPEAEPALAGDTPPPRASGLADTGPHPVQRTMPTLPADASPDFRGAAARVRVTVDEDGQVSDAEILTSSGSPLLDQAALDSVRQWEYDPAIRNGQSVPAVVTEQVKFVSR